jgi:hypothetical protein
MGLGLSLYFICERLFEVSSLVSRSKEVCNLFRSVAFS